MKWKMKRVYLALGMLVTSAVAVAAIRRYRAARDGRLEPASARDTAPDL